ncbi:hypothetical protein RND81_07G090000 [Saponaria officinalis]|uniref:Glycosyltransferase n=1 Tax=Saponaria officinalis TaxID=3572 RepID=A0AAW1JP43_SAPOF
MSTCPMTIEEPQESFHIVFFPMMGHGHMIPMLDIAKLFATHQVKTTIITTPCNATTFTRPLGSYKNVGPPIDVEIIPFPSQEAGLPEGIENFEDVTSPEMVGKLWKATQMLEEALEKVLEKLNPNGLIADKLFPFSTRVASKFGIPRLIFQGTGYFSLSIIEALKQYEPHKKVSSDDEEFVIPNLPNEIKMTRLKLPEHIRESDKTSNDHGEFLKLTIQAEVDSMGIICDTFYELEHDYARHCRNVLGKKIFSFGPVSLCNRDKEAKFCRGKDSVIDEVECLKWLDSKKEGSVVYVSFGTLTIFSTIQICQIARALEASEQEFIWVVKKTKGEADEVDEQDWLPEGFEDRVKDKGLIIKGWAPQMLILDHKSIGGFLTHCGWNSILEATSFGVPMVTWPVFADHFYNEILVTEILKTGISVGAKKWSRVVDDSVKEENVTEAIRRVMVGDEALDIRERANKLKEMARNAVEGGSSYNELINLIQLLRDYRP